MQSTIKLLSCSQGHFWETPGGGGTTHCPVCGELPESLPLLAPASDEAVTAEPVTVAPAQTASRRPNVPGYEIVEDRGRTSVGVALYVAKQALVPRTVLLKVVTAATDRGQRAWGALRGEAVALGKISHPNVVQLYGAGEFNRELFYNALEFVDGQTLAQKWSAKPLPFRQAAALIEVLARAVQFAHDQGLVHRSLRPAAVQLQLHKSESRAGTVDAPLCLVHSMRCIPKITGFGLARRPVEGEINDLDLQEGMPSYLAPEQVWGRSKDIGPATDVYALGAILYELVSGRPPFAGSTLSETLDLIQSRPAPPPGKWRGGVPADLAAVCEKCLEKQPRHRYRSAAALADDLRRFLDGRPVHARPVGLIGRTWRGARRRPGVALLVVLTLASLAVTAATSLSSRRDPPVRPGAVAAPAARGVTQWRVNPGFPATRPEASVDPLTSYSRSLVLAQRALQAKLDDRARMHLGQCPLQMRDWEWYALSQKAHPGPPLVWERPATPVRGMAFCPDGSFLAAFSDNKANLSSVVTTWNEADRRIVRSQPVPELQRLTALTWGSDSNWLLALDGSGAVGVLQRNGGLQEVRNSQCGPHDVAALAISDPSARRWVIGALEAPLLLVHEGPRVTFQTPVDADGVSALAVCTQKSYLAAGDRQGFVRVWDIKTGRQLCTLEGHSRAVTALAFNYYGTRLVSGGRDGALCVWDPAEGKEIFRFDGPAAEPTALAFRPDRPRLIVARGLEITQWGD